MRERKLQTNAFLSAISVSLLRMVKKSLFYTIFFWCSCFYTVCDNMSLNLNQIFFSNHYLKQ